jgi:diguanylate cyclase (GGDEF)-like protein
VDAPGEDALLHALFAAARGLVAFERAFVWTVPAAPVAGASSEPPRLELRVVWPSAAPPETLPLAPARKLAARVIALRRGLAVTRAGGTGGEGSALDEAASVLAVPLIAGGRQRVIGAAVFVQPGADLYLPGDVDLLQRVVNVVANGLENQRLHQSIRLMAITDDLTGQVNRRRLNELLARESGRARRYGRPLSVILCDVDNFKRFNDRHGHLRGDDLLRHMAGILAANTRESDIVARYGGEEFCIVLPETGRAQALHLAERVRAAVAAAVFCVENAAVPGAANDEDEPGIHKTMSLGVASFPDDSSDPAHLLELADAALYRAKRGGKNRVEAAATRRHRPFRAAPPRANRGNTARKISTFDFSAFSRRPTVSP